MRRLWSRYWSAVGDNPLLSALHFVGGLVLVVLSLVSWGERHAPPPTPAAGTFVGVVHEQGARGCVVFRLKDQGRDVYVALAEGDGQWPCSVAFGPGGPQ